jgi:hypothetical protein
MRDGRLVWVRSLTAFTVVALIAMAAPAHAASGADMRIDRVTTNVTAGPLGTKVVFKIVAEDVGPDPITSSLDVYYDEARDVRTGPFNGFDESAVNLRIDREECFWDGFGGVGPSADTPFCEFGEAVPGDPVFVKIVATLVANTHAHIATLGFAVQNESGELDLDLSNNWAVSRIHIT